MKSRTSISLPLALRFMLLLAASMLALSVLFVALLRLSVTHKQDSDLAQGISLISESLASRGTDELAFLELPYYITYAVWERDGRVVLSTNDSLLPLLESNGKSRTHFEKDFFTDSDLNIRYRTKTLELGGKSLVVECAIDIANDSAAQMLSALPRLALISLVPILILSFALSFLISRSTIRAFNKLRSDYDREKAFTSNVSHELKTPISIIDGHANLLKRWGKDDPAQLLQSIDAILHETENMNAIVTTLLDMSRIENGTLKIEKSKFFVTNFFAKLKDEFKITHPDCTIHIDDEDFLEIETDEQKLHQIFTVILSNSVKFAGENCTITLRARKIGSKIELSASDNGAGFSEEVLVHVFERFYKGDQAHDRNISGAGLGLSIAKTLALALGGEIRAENAENGGAKVTVRV
ncbi:MAG: HAMP domain-containing histidine kinase [Treponema sp.]|nr:HAMP domain-containing histidine kinase [Treponema sp.]